MPSLEMDELLARLYVDSRLRSDFLADRRGFALRYGCDVAFAENVQAEELEFFAASLVRKRANEVSKLIPLTVTALGDQFEPLFGGFAAASIPAGYNKHAADALAFCQHVCAASPNGLCAETARFDYDRLSLRLRCVSEGGTPRVFRAVRRALPWVRLTRFSGRLRRAVERDVDENGVKDEMPSQRVLVLFLSFPGLSGIWYW